MASRGLSKTMNLFLVQATSLSSIATPNIGLFGHSRRKRLPTQTGGIHLVTLMALQCKRRPYNLEVELSEPGVNLKWLKNNAIINWGQVNITS